MLAFQNSQGDPLGGLIALLVIVLLIVAGFAFYFLPAIIAILSKHQQAPAIFVLNLLAGWTFIGWVAALVWSFVQSRPQQVVYVQQQSVPQPRPVMQNPVPPPDYNYRRINR